MNLDGAEDVAESSAGNIAQVDEGAIITRYQGEIDPDSSGECRKKSVLEKYYWKGPDESGWFEPYPVTPHPKKVWAQDTAKVNHLDRQIAAQKDLKAQALSDDRNLYQTQMGRRDTRRDQTYGRLRVAVSEVYFLSRFIGNAG
ncbi:MAG: hypothetical protein AAF587_02290 [Bacteroidota bacterium]